MKESTLHLIARIFKYVLVLDPARAVVRQSATPFSPRSPQPHPFPSEGLQ
jgi:hypothetical protein